MQTTSLKENQGKTYSVIMLTVTDPKGYEVYREATENMLKEAGGTVEREFDVLGQKGNIPNFEAPNRLVVIAWNSPEGHQKLMNRPKYKKASEILNASASDIRVAKGVSALFQSSDSDESGRMYLMKISYYKENTPGRLDMLKEIGPMLAPYGFYSERMIMPKQVVGFERPDEITIHFHDFAAQNDELQKDESVLKAIGEYNDKFLDQFVYLPLKLK